VFRLSLQLSVSEFVDLFSTFQLRWNAHNHEHVSDDYMEILGIGAKLNNAELSWNLQCFRSNPKSFSNSEVSEQGE
jgi:hypothetical protein